MSLNIQSVLKPLCLLSISYLRFLLSLSSQLFLCIHPLPLRALWKSKSLQLDRLLTSWIWRRHFAKPKAKVLLAPPHPVAPLILLHPRVLPTTSFFQEKFVNKLAPTTLVLSLNISGSSVPKMSLQKIQFLISAIQLVLWSIAFCCLYADRCLFYQWFGIWTETDSSHSSALFLRDFFHWGLVNLVRFRWRLAFCPTGQRID